MKKKIEVVELNKKEEKIILEEDLSIIQKFWKKYNKLFLLILIILSLTLLVTGIIVAISNVQTSDKMIIKETSIYTDLDVSNEDVTANGGIPITDKTAKEIFKNSNTFKSSGAVLLVKTVSKGQYIIKFYSDYTAIKIMKKGGEMITKINPIDEKTYGIKENGVTDSKAETIDLTITNKKQYPWGVVTYYSDGSAEVTESDMTIYVRDANDINYNYISDNKIAYVKKEENIKGTKLKYYYDGTIEVSKGNQSYIVRNEEDLNITNDGVTFKNENEETIYETKKLSDGTTIDYYTDGGAIIRNGNKTLSVRKSNSIIIKDNKIYEIVDNIYVTVSKVSNNGNIIYYTNGSAVIKNYNGKTVYVKDNSDIKFQNGIITNIGTDYEELTNERNLKENIKTFETISIIETNEYIAIVPKEDVLYDTDGSLKEIIVNQTDDTNKPITITNDTNEVIKYRLVIEKSNRTTLDTQYIKYQLSANETYIEPTRLETKIWNQDTISDGLEVKGTNYILIERTLEPMETDNIRVMFWIDYDTVPNTMQDKYFYGTIRLYAWQEIEVNV